MRFQCSSASRKFLTPARSPRVGASARVSVLFSEPKIPQSVSCTPRRRRERRFSALQRAENSSIVYGVTLIMLYVGFSALQRAENSSILLPRHLFASPNSFSALQRAENSSIHAGDAARSRPDRRFQCSSASRKFLNNAAGLMVYVIVPCFSALQRAENSSIKKHNCVKRHLIPVSVLFSEPKIPQSYSRRMRTSSG